MEIAKILTLTLNPSLDITMWVDGLDDEDVNNVKRERVDAGGKGINVSRALRASGAPTRAFILAGRANVPVLKKFLEQEKVDSFIAETAGAIRENYTMVKPQGICKLNKPGQAVDLADYDRLVRELLKETDDKTFVVISGSLPKNITCEHLRLLTGDLSARKIPFALDTKSLSASELISLKPYLIKPNAEEFLKLTRRTAGEDIAVMVNSARELIEQGIPHILLSLGARGLIYISRDGYICADVPDVPVRSAVGAGDTCLAGYLYARTKNLPLEECVRYAAAFGTASVMKDGTAPPDMAVVNGLLRKVTISATGF